MPRTRIPSYWQLQARKREAYRRSANRGLGAARQSLLRYFMASRRYAAYAAGLGRKSYSRATSTRAKRRNIARRRQRALIAAGRRMLPPTSYGGKFGENKYVDGFYNVAALHELSDTADDTWADCETNPRQTTAVYGCMPVPRQGTNYADRDGRKIYMKNLHIKGQILWDRVDSTTTPVQVGAVRIVIVKDTKTDGTALSAENVIGPGLGSDGMATTSGDGCALQMPTNPDGWGRYKILYDKTFRPPVQSSWGDNTNAGNVNGFWIPFKISLPINCEVNFSASTGAVGSIVDNSIHMIAAAQSGGTNPTMTYYARQSFVG